MPRRRWVVLRAFRFGHVRQLDAVASRSLAVLANQTPLVRDTADVGSHVLVDVDDTIIEVHGYASRAPGSDTPVSAA